MWPCHKSSSVSHVAAYHGAAALCLWHAEIRMETDGRLTPASSQVAKWMQSDYMTSL